MNLGRRGTRATVGIPGTGLSYSTKVAGNRKSKSSSHRSSSHRTRKTAGVAWNQEKEGFEAAEAENEIKENDRYNAEFNASKQYMNDLINGEEIAVSEAVESWISSCELPVEIRVDYEWNQSSNTMYLDVDLPEIKEDFMYLQKNVDMIAGTSEIPNALVFLLWG